MVRSCFCGNEQNVSLKLTSRIVMSYVELCVYVRVCVYLREKERREGKYWTMENFIKTSIDIALGY